jgi:CRISPR-associated protein Cas2
VGVPGDLHHSGGRQLQHHQLRRLRQGLDRIAEPADSIRLWSLPQRAVAAEQMGREVEVTIWQDKVI